MEKGLLWFDDDPRKQLEEKVRRAASRYEAKHGRSPNLCFVHSSALGDDLSVQQTGGNGKVRKAGRVEIRTGRSVLPHHFWIGVVEQPKPRQIEMKLPDVREPQSNEVER